MCTHGACGRWAYARRHAHTGHLRTRKYACPRAPQAKLAEVEQGTVAGVATHLEPAHYGGGPVSHGEGEGDAAAMVGEVALPVPQQAPDTVGMNRAAALEAKRAWRLQLSDRPMTADGVPPPTPDFSAGMSSEYRSRSVRAQVGVLDASSAAEYNLAMKLGQGTPRSSSLAPWLGGGERQPPEPAPLTDASNREGSNALPLSAGLHGAPPSGISTLSHAEKLRRMRELRQSAMDSPRM